MVTQATLGSGTKFQVGDAASPEVFSTIAEVESIAGLNLSAAVIDVTNMDSPDSYMEYIAGLRDTGEITFEINYGFAETTHGSKSAQGILHDFAGDGTVRRNYQIIFPDATNTVWSFAGFVTDVSLTTPVDAEIKASVTIKVTGKPTFGN